MRKILLSCGMIAGIAMSAQVSGTKTIGVDYATLDAAFADLNVSGVGAGGATINVPAGYSENVPVGGYLLGSAALNSSLSAANQLIIQKSGAGSNPLFTGAAGTTSGATGIDSMFRFVGVDYMTVDGLDLQENAANIDAITLNERGFAFYNLNATDGCNYNTVKNSTITFLKNLNNGAAGINFAHTDAAGVTIVPTSADGTHSNNKIYSNTITKSLGSAISFTGFAAPTPFALYDQNNDIGGNTAATGNTITDFGGVAGGSFYIINYAIFGVYQNNTNVSNNIVTFTSDGLGTVGIYLFGTNSSYTANSNTVNAVGQTYNSSPNVSMHTGIYSNAAGTNLTANNNKFNISATTFNGLVGVSGINFLGTGNLTANGNTISSGVSPSSYYGIYSAAVTIDINNNNISGISSVGASSNVSGLYLTKAATGNVSKNKIYNLQANGATGSVYGIYAGGSQASTSTNIFNNVIGDLKAPVASSTSVSVAGLYLASSGVTSNLNVYFNTINLSASSSGANFNSAGVYHSNSIATTAVLDLRDNMIVNTSVPKGTGTASALRRSVNGVVNYAATSNNNNLFGTSFPFVGGTTGNTLAQLQAMNRDANSLSENALFSSTNGLDTDFLNLNPAALTTQTLDNKGAAIAGYTLDYTGATRATTPDIGAYEFTYVAPVVVPSCTVVSTPADMATGVKPNSATLSWAAATNATSYKLTVGTASGLSDVLNVSGITLLSYEVALVPNTQYFVKVTATNNIGDATGCTETSFTTGNVVYCDAKATTLNDTFERITNVKFNTIDNPSTPLAVSGYEDFTAISTTVRRESVYPMTVTVVNYDGDKTSVWIDYNQNGSFEDATERVDLLNADPDATGNITIPADAKLGMTRMRVRTNYSALAPACGDTSYGQVEDYTVNIDVALAAGNTVKSNLAVYPNPFKDVLKISDIKGVKSISVTDMSGRQVKNLKPSAELNLSELNAGLYIVTLKMEDGTSQTFKTIKK